MKHKSTLPLVVLLVLSGLALFLSQAAAEQTILPVAVFNFESNDEAVNGLGPKISDLINADLSTEPNLITVERADLKKILAEQEFGLSGAVTPDSAAKAGNLTGAKVLVTGRVFDADNQRIVVAKVIGTETSRVYGEMVEGPAAGSVVDLSSALAKKIATVISEKGSTLVAKVESRAERIAAIKKELAGEKLPTVSVKISEQYFGAPVIDPAAQTELSLILEQCGFKLTDDDSTNRPDIEITGDAFSEFGMQKGNLKSCRARIEIKAHNAATGAVIAVDRQTSVGIDIAEHIAAKTALENAADELAERVIPKLMQ